MENKAQVDPISVSLTATQTGFAFFPLGAVVTSVKMKPRSDPDLYNLSFKSLSKHTYCLFLFLMSHYHHVSYFQHVSNVAIYLFSHDQGMALLVSQSSALVS